MVESSTATPKKATNGPSIATILNRQEAHAKKHKGMSSDETGDKESDYKASPAERLAGTIRLAYYEQAIGEAAAAGDTAEVADLQREYHKKRLERAQKRLQAEADANDEE